MEACGALVRGKNISPLFKGDKMLDSRFAEVRALVSVFGVAVFC